MSDRHYTIMIVPGSRAKLVRLRVRRGTMLALAILAGVGLLSAAVLPVVFYQAASRAVRLTSLAEENAALKQAGEEIDQLRDQVSMFENKATKFALMAGVENLPSAQGVGGLRQEGLEEEAILQDDLANLKERSGVLAHSYELLEKVYRDQSLLLSSTPSIAPVKGLISYGHGWRRDPFTGQRAFHHGLDLVAPRGTKVLAPADGVITKAGREPGYGNVVYISHGNGLSSRYAHLEGFAVRPGQDVHRGSVLGFVGNTGRSLGAHLHYEVLVNNSKVDPMQYILDEAVSY